MVSVTRTCDICGKDRVRINVKYKVKGLRKGFGLHGWCDVDICDDCINEIRKTVNMKTILSGISPLDNVTNGDVIKAMFPDIEIYNSTTLESIYTGIPFGKYIGANINCKRNWWNTLFKRGEQE